MQNFRGNMGVCVVGKWPCEASKFRFSFLRHARRSHRCAHPYAHYVVIRRYDNESAFGVRKIKFET